MTNASLDYENPYAIAPARRSHAVHIHSNRALVTWTLAIGLLGCNRLTEKHSIGHHTLMIRGTIETEVSDQDFSQLRVIAKDIQSQSIASSLAAANGGFELQLSIQFTAIRQGSTAIRTADAGRVEFFVRDADGSNLFQKTLDTLIGRRSLTGQDLDRGVFVRVPRLHRDAIHQMNENR